MKSYPARPREFVFLGVPHTDHVANLPGARPSEAAAIKAEAGGPLVERVRTELARLPLADQEILAMSVRRLSGYERISLMLAIPPDVARVRLQAARERLRRRLFGPLDS